MFWRLQTRFWEKGGWRRVMFCLHFGFSVHTICHVLRQVRKFRAALGLAESNLINSSSRRSCSIEQELLVSPMLRHSSGHRVPAGDPCPMLAAGDAFLGSPVWNQELLQSVSLIRCQQTAVLEEISNPSLDERSPTLLLILAEVWSLSRFTHHWV